NALEAARDVRRGSARQRRAVMVDVGRSGARVGVFLGDRRAALACRQLRDQQQPWSHAGIITARAPDATAAPIVAASTRTAGTPEPGTRTPEPGTRTLEPLEPRNLGTSVLHEPFLLGQEHELQAPLDPELLVDVMQVHFDGTLRDDEPLADHPVA